MKKDLKFEEAVEELEQILQTLEGGKLGLEEAIKTYEHGMELIKLCDKKLNDAHKKLLLLDKDEQGQLKLKELAISNPNKPEPDQSSHEGVTHFDQQDKAPEDLW